jgi:hypothetical protein
MNMRRLIRIAVVTGGWLLASPSLQLQFNAAPWLEVGPSPTLAATAKHRPHHAVRHKVLRRVVVRGSSTPPGSNQPGLYPFNPVMTVPDTTVRPTVTEAPPVPGYPQVPTVAILPRGSTGGTGAETFSDRAVRCSHQAGLGGLTGGEQKSYVSTCAAQ